MVVTLELRLVVVSTMVVMVVVVVVVFVEFEQMDIEETEEIEVDIEAHNLDDKLDLNLENLDKSINKKKLNKYLFDNSISYIILPVSNEFCSRKLVYHRS